MFTTDTASGIEADLENCGAQILDPLLGPWIGCRIKDEGVEIAIAGMEDVGHRQSVLATETLDLCQYGGKAAPGNDAVLDVIRGSDLADSRKSGFSALPQNRTFLGLLSPSQSSGACSLTKLLGLLR